MAVDFPQTLGGGAAASYAPHGNEEAQANQYRKTAGAIQNQGAPALERYLSQKINPDRATVGKGDKDRYLGNVKSEEPPEGALPIPEASTPPKKVGSVRELR
jgi:flagellar hook-length control protein FliK